MCAPSTEAIPVLLRQKNSLENAIEMVQKDARKWEQKAKKLETKVKKLKAELRRQKTMNWWLSKCLIVVSILSIWVMCRIGQMYSRNDDGILAIKGNEL